MRESLEKRRRPGVQLRGASQREWAAVETVGACPKSPSWALKSH